MNFYYLFFIIYKYKNSLFFKMKSLRNLNGLSFNCSQRIPFLYEEYGILDRDSNVKNKLQELSQKFYRISLMYDEYEDIISISNLVSWLDELIIEINTEFPYEYVFNVHKEFKIENNKVKKAVIQINPKIFKNIIDIYSGIYHEIKHIFDVLMLKTEKPFKENVLRGFLIKDDNIEMFTNYLDFYIDELNDEEIMEFIAKMLIYIEKSECSAYLENIDQEYKDTLNNKELIMNLLYNGYKLNQIKNRLFYNAFTTNYVLIYHNIEKYLNQILERDLKVINEKYKEIFDNVYNVRTLEKVIKVYLKRIQKVFEQSRKLYSDRYESSFLKQLIEK